MKNVYAIIIGFAVFIVLASGCDNNNNKLSAVIPTATPLTETVTTSTETATPSTKTETLSTVLLPDISASLESVVTSSEIAGYWANIYIDSDGIAHLNGFYFSEDSTSLMFHASEGAFNITSYSVSDNTLLYTFLNMDEEPIESCYRILAVSENQIVLEYDDSDATMCCYERMLKIESTSSLGSYTVTRIDGTTFDIQGY